MSDAVRSCGNVEEAGGRLDARKRWLGEHHPIRRRGDQPEHAAARSEMQREASEAAHERVLLDASLEGGEHGRMERGQVTGEHEIARADEIERAGDHRRGRIDRRGEPVLDAVRGDVPSAFAPGGLRAAPRGTVALQHAALRDERLETARRAAAAAPSVAEDRGVADLAAERLRAVEELAAGHDGAADAVAEIDEHEGVRCASRLRVPMGELSEGERLNLLDGADMAVEGASDAREEFPSVRPAEVRREDDLAAAVADHARHADEHRRGPRDAQGGAGPLELGDEAVHRSGRGESDRRELPRPRRTEVGGRGLRERHGAYRTLDGADLDHRKADARAQRNQSGRTPHGSALQRRPRLDLLDEAVVEHAVDHLPRGDRGEADQSGKFRPRAGSPPEERPERPPDIRDSELGGVVIHSELSIVSLAPGRQPRMSLLATAILAVAASTTPPAPPRALAPLPPGAVRLADGPLRAAFERNRAYVRSFEPDRLLWTFRRQAGLATPGAPLGGWESPDGELRGHSIGHYLAAAATILSQVDDPEIRADARSVVAGLAECQRAAGNGWISAFPEEFLDRVENGRPVWAPYYTLHKILAGLVAMHARAGDREALEVALGLARRIDERCARLDEAAMQRMLGNEFGGMHEVLLDLAAGAADEGRKETAATVARLAARFQKRSFLEPLAAGGDPLPGLHANTHLAQIHGQMRAYEHTGDARARAIVERFWQALHRDHSYATGGSNSGEYWGPPGRLANTLSATNQEFCTSHNWSRITTAMLHWTGDVAFADELERVFHNGITVSQHPESGMFLYYLPLATGLRKEHGTPFDTMTCCYGTGIEAYAQLAEGICLARGDDLVIARYAASAIDWASPRAGRVALRQRTNFPESGVIEIDIDAVERPAEFAIALRLPGWATAELSVAVNGEPVAVPPRTPGTASWLDLRRTWNAGDRIRLAMAMPLRVVTMPDDPSLGAICAGPLVLAGIVESAPDELPVAPIIGDKLTPGDWLVPTGASLTWRTRDMPVERTYVPLERIVGERYGVYWPFGVPGGARQNAYNAAVAALADRDRRTLDSVAIGDEASERAHDFAGEATRTGEANGRRWRDATRGGHMRYRLAVAEDAACELALTYFTRDGGGDRVFDILVDGVRIASERLIASADTAGERFITVAYAIPTDLTRGKRSVEVRIEPAPNGAVAGGIFGLRTLRNAS